MKKIIGLMTILFFFAGTGFAATQIATHLKNLSVVDNADTEAPTNTLVSGDAYIESDLEIDGNLEIAGTLTYSGVVTSTLGYVNVTDVFDDVPVTNETGHFAFVISTTVLVAGTTAISGGNITQPVIPMNVVVFSSAAGTVAAGNTLGASLLVTGYDGRGESQAETIKLVNAAVSGVKAWSYITSFTISSATGTAGGNAMINVGVGTILGLSNHIEQSGLVADGGDVIWAQLNDSGTTATDSPTVSTVYNTWTPDTAGDGAADVYTIRYKVKKR